MFIAMLVLMFVFDWRTVEAADKIVVLKDGEPAERKREMVSRGSCDK